jgi:hypothetical protein
MALMGRISSCPGVVITELMLSSLIMYSGLYHHAAHPDLLHSAISQSISLV